MNIHILEITENISKKDDFIKQYNLKYINKYKYYKIYDTYIVSDGENIIFEKHKNISNKEYYVKSIAPFSFYDVEDEFIYDKYMNKNYVLKVYEKKLTLEFINK